jgi:ATP-dependent helicase/nuclease subunit A
MPSLSVVSPSTGKFEGGEEDVRIQVVYDEKEMDFRVEGTFAATIGTLTHKLMEANPSNLQKATATIVKNENVKMDPSHLISLVKALRKKSLVKRLNHAKTILREVPIKFKTPGNVYYDGSIDLLFEEDDGWVLVDYKTIIVSDKQQEQKVRKKYKAQMGMKVKDVLIVSC